MKRNDIPKEVVKSGKRDSTLVSDLITQCWIRPWLVNFKRFIQPPCHVFLKTDHVLKERDVFYLFANREQLHSIIQVFNN